MRHPTVKLLTDVLLAVVIVLVGLLLAGFVTAKLGGAQETPTPAVSIKLWRITDPQDPILAAAAVEAPAFLLELGFADPVWPVKDHQIVGLTRQTVRLVQREWRIGLPIIARSFIDHGAGEVPYMYSNGAAGIVLQPSGFSFYF